MDFPRFSNMTLLFEIRIFSQAPGKILKLTTMALVRVKHPKKKEGDALGPRQGDSGSGQNPASRRRGWPGKGRGGDHELTTRRFEAGNGAGMELASSLGGTGRRRPRWHVLR
jgi:hypothetical protein